MVLLALSKFLLGTATVPPRLVGPLMALAQAVPGVQAGGRVQLGGTDQPLVGIISHCHLRMTQPLILASTPRRVFASFPGVPRPSKIDPYSQEGQQPEHIQVGEGVRFW